MKNIKASGGEDEFCDVEQLLSPGAQWLTHTTAARVIEFCGVAVVAYRLNGEILSWNREAERLFGHPAEHVTGSTIACLGIDELYGEDSEILARLRSAQAIEGLNVDCICRGVAIRVRLSLFPFVKPNSPEVVAICLFAQKATGHTPASPRDTEVIADLEQILEQSPARISLWDENLVCRYANSGYAAFFGLVASQIVGKTAAEVLGSERFARGRGLIEATLKGEPQSFERDIRLADGDVLHELIHYEPVRDAQRRGLLVYITDITARKRAEQQAATSAAQFRALYKHTPAILHSIDRQGRLVSVSDEWLRVLGYSQDEVIGRLSTDFLTPESRRKAKELYLPRFWAKNEARDLEYQMVAKDGKLIDVLLSAVTDKDAEGQPRRSMAVIVDVTERKKAERSLHEHKLLLDHAERLAGVGAWSYDVVSGAIYWSDQLCRMLDVPLKHQPSFEEAVSFFAPECRQMVRDAAVDSVERGIPVDQEMQLVTAKGRTLWAQTASKPEIEDGVTRRVFGAIQDITARKEVERRLASQNALLRTTLDSIGDAVITTDPQGQVEWLNPVASALTGWTLSEARGRAVGEIFCVVYEDGRHPTDSPIQRARKDHVGVAPEHLLLIDRQGRERSIIDSAAPIRDNQGVVSGYVMVFHDVSEQRRLAREVSHRASHDALTGLVNRAEFELRLRRAFSRAQTEGNASVLLYIDLDQFKIVNDTCGHSAGDQLLRAVATLFTTCLRSSDLLARLGGDEFAVLLENCTSANARDVAQQLCDHMDRYRFDHAGERFRVGASIGMVPVDRHWSSEAEILRAADGACYAAKEAGRNRVHEWSDSDTKMLARQHEMQWASQIESALDENRFRLYGQKMVGCRGSLPTWHIEVLLRLSTAEGDLVSPGAFLPAAERFNLASRIDRWVLREVTAFLAKNDCRMLDTVGVNLSGQSIGDRSFHRYAMELIRDIGIDARKLCFEITETAAITYMGDASEFINSMRALGVRIALDDFGSGISSFGYLKALPLDFLKIDRSFVQRILHERLDHVAVSSFCSAAKVCGLKTIAEGVESKEVMKELQRIGVDMAQGFLFHRPEPLQQLVDALVEPLPFNGS
jgi:diguanylate cyclase (GGDEF)-like protein/PAS domain S-box-containing protein